MTTGIQQVVMNNEQQRFTGIIIFVPNQNCSKFQIESGTTESVKNFKIDFLSEASLLTANWHHTVRFDRCRRGLTFGGACVICHSRH
jgi:hypothetical protein